MAKRIVSGCVLVLAALLAGNPAIAHGVGSGPKYLKLSDNLDRPNDGYCLDIPGVGRNVRLDRPLSAHNCKPNAAPDGVIVHRADGSLYFPAYDVCVTAMGVNGNSLPGAALMGRPCTESGGFSASGRLKTFEFTQAGQLAVAGSDLCLTVGAQSSPTLSSRDRWRPLFLETCAIAPVDRSQWQLIAPLP